jgi:aromatic-L-amino-acid decarboxylase
MDLDPEQTHGATDMDPASFRAAAHAVVDVMADYLDSIETRHVFPSIEPGSLRPLFPTHAPEAPESLERILDDYRRLIEPNATHWQHPGFLAYFATTASGPGILGEMLTAALAPTPRLGRTSPTGTELELVVVDWLPLALGLPATSGGLHTDTASPSSPIPPAGAR